MEKDGKIYISEYTSLNELFELDLELCDGKRKDIDKAIDIFKERIEGRYFNPIDWLNNESYENGFASIALCCLLIDAFYQFKNGLSDAKGKNRKCYIDFLEKDLYDMFDTHIKAKRFYDDIRCGILHSAQTKNGSRLSVSTENAVELININRIDSPIVVNVVLFSSRLKQYFYEYIERIREDEEIQDNFVSKLKKMFEKM